MGKLDGKVAIITGAARGMGAAHAELFVAEGARVVMCDVLAEELRERAAGLGDSAIAVAMDVSDPAAWTDAVEQAATAFGTINVLVNNAAVMSGAAIQDVTWEEYLRVIGVNQHGVFLGMQAVLPFMREAGGSSIVNISSVSGMGGSPSFAYSTSKWAVRGMTKTAAVTLAEYGIRVNSVHPGAVTTPMVANRRLPSGAVFADDAAGIPLGRVGEPLDVARLVLFLASDESSFITGSEHVIDGGQLARVSRSTDATARASG
jgi:3alpha(or 20beta)-hydroxysteroid dehydrogenase